jgi:ATP-dependent Clp protease protease subunit
VNKFWNFSKCEDGGRVLRFDGVIAAESWWGDEITPEIFRAELFAGDGDITVWLNSPGGDCIAASQIYTMLMDYKGSVTVKIDGIAASAASVIAMAGTQVLMAPTALLMVHNPMTWAIGDSDEMQKAIDMLAAVKESIINAYQIKSGQGRTKLSNLMDAETWLPAQTAIEMGFADGILEDNKRQGNSIETPDAVNYTFSRKAVTNSLLDKMAIKPKGRAEPLKPFEPNKPQGITAESLEKRLSLISH